jgi:hypothetical protein
VDVKPSNKHLPRAYATSATRMRAAASSANQSSMTPSSSRASTPTSTTTLPFAFTSSLHYSQLASYCLFEPRN